MGLSESSGREINCFSWGSQSSQNFAQKPYYSDMTTRQHSTDYENDNPKNVDSVVSIFCVGCRNGDIDSIKEVMKANPMVVNQKDEVNWLCLLNSSFDRFLCYFFVRMVALDSYTLV